MLILAGCSSGGGGGLLTASTGSMDDGLTSGALFGRVTDSSSGAGMGTVRLALERIGGTSAASKTASSEASTVITIDADGRFESPDMLAGRYTVRATRDGFDTYAAQVEIPGGKRIEHNIKMTVSNGTTGIRGFLKDGRQQVVSGAVIKLTSTSKTASAQTQMSTTSNSDGWYTITGVTPGVYTATIEHSSFARQQMSITVKSGEMQQLDLVMQPGTAGSQADILGYVRDSRGRPIAGANVSLDYVITRGKTSIQTVAARPDARKSASTIAGFTTTDANGFYAFLDVDPGSYVVKAEHPDYLANSVQVTVAAGQTVSRDITLHWKLTYNGEADYFLGVWGTSASNVYAVGSLGVIKHFDGSAWKYQKSPTGENLFGVWGTADGSLVLAVGNSNLVARTTDGGATWSAVGAGIGASCHAVWGTPDGSAIYAISPFGAVFKSTDRGLTWTKGQYTTDTLPSPRSAAALNRIFGTPDGASLFVTGYSGTIYRSKDGGATWQPIRTGIAENFRQLHCWVDKAGARHVLASGDQSTAVARSDDDGATWVRTDLPAANPTRPYDQRSLWGLADGSAVYALTSQYVARSGDGGRTWTKVGDADIIDYAIWVTLDTVTGETVFMGSGEGRIWRATDGGQLWHIVNEGKVWSLYSVYAFTASEICAVGESNPSSVQSGFYIAGLHGEAPYKTTAVNVYTQALRAIFGAPDLLYAAAATKGLCISQDRGATWSQWLVADKYYLTGLSGGTTAAKLVSVGYDQTTDEGLILYQTPDNKWHSVHTNVGVHLRSVVQIPGQQRYVAVGDLGAVYLSNDDATQWVAANVNGVSDNLYAVWGAGPGLPLYAVGDAGTLLTSSDAGQTWTKTQLGIGPLYGVWGTSATDVYAVGLEIFHYDGQSWTKTTTQNEGTVETDKFLSVGVNGSPDGTRVYAVGLGGRVYVTER